MKRIIIILAHIIFCCSIRAQYDPATQVQYASPEASEFCQIEDVPVDLYTGRLSFDIPLFQIKQGDVPLNISIAYHGNGIRVDEESGFVGLGWILNAGGCVSRIVRGLPDDMYDSTNKVAGYERMNSMSSFDGLSGYGDYINLIKYSNQDRDPVGLGEPVTNAEKYKTYMIGLYGDKYDEHRFESSPDNYQYRVSDLSGAFARIGNRIIQQSNDGCRVQYSNYTYKISDARGNTYYFNDAERKDYIYTADFVWETDPDHVSTEYKTDYYSAWWLSKIVNERGDSISFSYIDRHISHPKSYTRGFTQVERFYYDNVLNRINSRMYTKFHDPFVTQCKDSVKHKLLSRIDFATGYVLFYYSDDPNRNYLSHLDSIRIYAYPSNAPCKRILFSYSGSKGKELLMGVTIAGSGGQSYSYAFTYHRPLAPETDSNNHDHWGYYSSSVSGYFPSGRYFSQDIMYHGTDRQSDLSNANNNMLKTITYPTGGQVSLDWESHDYSSLSLLGNQSIQESYTTPNNVDTLITDYYTVLCGKQNAEHLTASIAIQAGRALLVDLRDYYDGATNDYASCIYEEQHFPTLMIKKNSQIWDSVNISTDFCRLLTYQSVPAGIYSFELKNPRNGIYDSCGARYIDLFNMCCPDVSKDGHIYITVQHHQSSSETQQQYAGGVRIKKITYNAGTQSGYTKEYEYKNENNQSSGVLAYPPRYGSRFSFCEEFPIPTSFGQGSTYTACTKLVTLRSNPLPFVLNTDGHIGYTRVTETMTGASVKMNKVVYNFQAADMNHSDINDTERFYESFVPADMMQLTSQSYQRGHLISKTEYTDDSLTTYYTYDIQEQLETDTLTGSMFTIADYRKELRLYPYNGMNIKPYKDLGIVKYRIIPYNKRISSVQKSGGKMNTKEWYTYENDHVYSPSLNANMPITHSFINSAGDTITDHYTYMQNRSFVLSCITTCNNKVISAYRYAYDQKHRIYAIYRAKLQQNNLPSFQSFNVNDINSLMHSYVYRNDRLSEAIDAYTGQTTTYLWSYNNSYPVAEISNATYEQIASFLSTSAIQSIRSSYVPNMTPIDALRESLPNSLVTTRTYSPLVGITSETDAAGNTTYYDYDGLGRLHRTYIMNGSSIELLKQYEYHLSN